MAVCMYVLFLFLGAWTNATVARSVKVQWVQHNPEYHGKRNNNLSSKGGSTNMGNKRMTLHKEFTDGILVVKDQNYVQVFIY